MNHAAVSVITNFGAWKERGTLFVANGNAVTAQDSSIALQNW
jgi:hypothetical protein